MSVGRFAGAPPTVVFEWLGDASNHTRPPFIPRKRLIWSGKGAAYGLGAVRQLTRVFGSFRKRITAYHPLYEFRYLVECSVPPPRRESGRLTFTDVPGGVHRTTTVELHLQLGAVTAMRMFGRSLLVYTSGRVLDVADAAPAAGSNNCHGGERRDKRRWQRPWGRDNAGPTRPVRRSKR